MKSFLVMFATLLALATTPVEAANSDARPGCVKQGTFDDGSAELRNKCHEPLNVQYCVDNSAHPCDCARTPCYATLKTFQDGVKVTGNLPNGQRTPNGRVRWGSCRYPLKATWPGGDKYKCE